MDTKYNYPIDKWNKAKEEMKQVIIKRAKVKEKISYSELVSRVQAIVLESESYALAAMLDEISTEESTAGRGMLSAIVVHKSGDMQPGPGFFELAKRLGHDTSDILQCWVDELKKVYAYWGKTGK